LTFPMQEGDKVKVHGSFDVYEPRGSYSIIASRIEQAGLGDLYQKFLKLKAELEEKGMFDEMYKQPIPKYATKIGVVTAPTGAAIQDIIRNAKLQNPSVEIILYPALVQGEGAAESVAKGIYALDQLGLDVLIVGRGGGSMEDLWAFNEEIVANAIFQAKTPIISAVGHETDTTIADYVADLRVATPTEGAKRACFSLEDVFDEYERFCLSFQRQMDYKLNNYHMRLDHLWRQCKAMSPDEKLKTIRSTMVNMHQRMQTCMDRKIKNLRYEIGVKATTIDERSPAKRLAGGYSYVTTKDGKKLSDASTLEVGDDIELYLNKGGVSATVTEIRE
ncbi:MAG: exodeoxyribonuclease VII large subunit, partial [Lachnospiraceae bacterium]|nr:exodeoxyribonuclease VII large subunit [Lachnospiraceae bacterium]